MRCRYWPVLAVLVAGCWPLGDREPDVDAARQFDRYPLYWVGERFEQWDLVHVGLPGPTAFTTLIYGDCTPTGDGGGCAPPLEIQIRPLCRQLEVATQAPIWKRRSIRGAPVGTSDSTPVLFTSAAQVKVYRGEGSAPGLELRALRALRSLNRVEPVIEPTGPIPAAPRDVLAGTQPCRAD